MAYTPFPAVPRGDDDGGGDGGGSITHNSTTDRNASGAHTISGVDGLQDALNAATITKVWNGSAFVTVPGATIYVGPSAESAVADSDGDQYLATD